jgi:aspartate racemase
MPKVAPSGGEVDWRDDEGTLGVVGVAPWATIAFCNALYAEVDARKDWHYPRVLLDINTKLPSRGRHLQLGEADPSPAIAATIDELAHQGATVAVVVCNTAHILFDRWGTSAPIPILHIVHETVRAAVARGARRAAALVSPSLASAGLYTRALVAAGLESVAVTEDQQVIVTRLIERVKTGAANVHLDATAARLLDELIGSGADTMFAGCTELSALAPAVAERGVTFVDSNVALARAALSHMAVRLRR